MYKILNMFCLLICLTLCCDSFAQTKYAVSDKSELSPEGKAELKKILDGCPTFDAEKAAKEFDDKTKKDIDVNFSKEKLNEVQTQAGKLYVPFKRGETITLETRKKSYTGAFGGIAGDKIMVGLDLVPTIDLSQDILDRADSELMMRKQMNYINKNYHTPKKEFEMHSNIAKKKYLKEQGELYERQKADSIADKKLGDKYPVLKNETVEGYLNITDESLKKTVVDKIKEEYSKSQPLKVSQVDILKMIFEKIAKENSKVAYADGVLIAK